MAQNLSIFESPEKGSPIGKITTNIPLSLSKTHLLE